MYKILLLIFCLLCFFSCDKTGEHKADGTYFGGVIENPRGDFAVLYHNDQVVDTIQLDDNNRFLYKNDSLCDGLYTFKHREYQRFYLNKNDSLLLHVNTIDFDESLKYSGIGSQKNNLLMKIFLDNEMVQKKLPEWFTLLPIEFLAKLDSVDSARKKLYNKHTTKSYTSSKPFNQLVKVGLTYDMSLWKEQYISANLLNGQSKILEQLPKAFLKHRKEIDYGNDLMRSHYSYYRFIETYYDNLAYDIHKKTDSFDRENYTHASSKIDVISKRTHHELLRNKLLRFTAAEYLMHTTNQAKAIEFFNLFATSSSNEDDIQQMSNILEQTIKLIPGNQIPNVALVGVYNETSMLHTIIKRPTVIYFWTYESTNHYREVHEKAKALRIKYPNIDFIAINADDNYRKWSRITETISTDHNTEYQLDNLPSAKSALILDRPERTIIVDAKGKITNSNVAITDAGFEGVL